MKKKYVLPQIVAVAATLLLLGALGVYWPQWVGADSAETRAIQSTVADAITYQGYLTDSSNTPLSGNFVMQFQIYNAASGGTLLWDSFDLVVPISLGKFTVDLDITPDIFNGEELWVSQIIGGEVLTPRQEIVPAPMAHTLRPGAIINAIASDIPNNYAVEVNMNNDEFADYQGAIRAEATTGNAIYGVSANGYGIRGQTSDGYAVYGYDGGINANQGYAGYFYSQNGIGVYGFSSADRTHPNIYAPGVYGESHSGVGVYGRGDTTDSFSFYNEGGRFIGGTGINAHGTDNNGYAGEFYGDEYRGLFVRGDNGSFDAYFSTGAGISASNVIDRGGRTQSLAINLGSTPIAIGDLVAIVGIGTNPENGEPLLGVAKLDEGNRNGVIGVAQEAMSAEATPLEDGSSYIDFGKTTASITPNSYLIIITNGLAANVNVTSVARGASWEIGDKIAISAGGEMSRATGAIDTIVVGKVAGAIDPATNTIPIFIDID